MKYDAKISYAGKRISIGLDVHKSFYVACAVFEGAVVKKSRMPAEPENVIKFINRYFPGADVITCYEAGFSGFALHRELIGCGIPNLVVHPASIEVSSRDRVKTDKRDAEKMAKQLDANRLRSVRIPSIEQECRRTLTRTRQQIVSKTTAVRNQIRMRLLQFGLIPSSYRTALSMKFARQVLAESVDNPLLELSIESLLSIWRGLNGQQKELEKIMRRQAAKDPVYAVWQSLPGIGIVSGLTLANELGDMSQFANERALFSFTGLTPSEHSSGNKVYRGHISRQGNAQLRHILVEAAWRAIRTDASLKEAFERIAARRGKKIAIVAIARKFVGRARAVFRSQNQYKLEQREAA